MPKCTYLFLCLTVRLAHPVCRPQEGAERRPAVTRESPISFVLSARQIFSLCAPQREEVRQDMVVGQTVQEFSEDKQKGKNTLFRTESKLGSKGSTIAGFNSPSLLLLPLCLSYSLRLWRKGYFLLRIILHRIQFAMWQ